MPRIATEKELAGAYPVFLLEIIWNGAIHRFSTFPIDIENDNNEQIHYFGGLSDPDLDEAMLDIGSSPEKNTLSLELVFQKDLVEQLFKYGLSLDGAKAELSFVTQRNNTIVQKYEKRIGVFAGEITNPIIGHPDQPVGYVAFSVERISRAKPIIDDKGIFRGQSSVVSSVHLGGLSDGLAYPIVFGQATSFMPVSGFNSTGFATLHGSPAFIIYREHTESAVTPNRSWYDKFWLVIAGHPVEATTVHVVDYKNRGEADCPVKNYVTEEGQEISYIELQFATLSGVTPVEEDGVFNPWMLSSIVNPDWDGQTDKPTYSISWTGGGAMSNPYGSGFLEGAGDIISYFLGFIDIPVDMQAFRNVAGFLNGWKFAGYIDDPKTKAWEWLSDTLLPFVPLHIANGAAGLRPVIPLLYSSNQPRPSLEITIGVGFFVVSALAIVNDPDDIVNRLLLNYALDLYTDTTRAMILISPFRDVADQNEVKSSMEIAELSYKLYGDRYQEIEATNIYDWQTALKSAQYILKRKALAKIQVEIQSDVQYGFLQIGDVVSLNSDDYFWSGSLAQIIEKSWNSGSWLFLIELENNVILNPRKRG